MGVGSSTCFRLCEFVISCVVKEPTCIRFPHVRDTSFNKFRNIRVMYQFVKEHEPMCSVLVGYAAPSQLFP